MSKILPTLSSTGWSRGLDDKVDRALVYAFLSDKDQSFLYGDNVTSIQGIVQETSYDPYALKDIINDRLEVYLRRLFEQVQVEVRIEDSLDGIEDDRIHFIIKVEVKDKGSSYSTGDFSLLYNGKLARFISINNYGLDPY